VGLLLGYGTGGEPRRNAVDGEEKGLQKVFCEKISMDKKEMSDM